MRNPYGKHFGEDCSEKPYEDSDCCILHINLPPDEDDLNRWAIQRAKKIKQDEKIAAGDFDFEGAQLVDFSVDEGTELSLANFVRATFSGYTSFDRATFTKELEARYTSFFLPYDQETLCRAAKQNCDGRGDRSDADYYFYREMEAMRKLRYFDGLAPPCLPITVPGTRCLFKRYPEDAHPRKGRAIRPPFRARPKDGPEQAPLECESELH